MFQSLSHDYTRPVSWQKPVQGDEEKLWDVLIVGAGPAGSTAAFHLSRKGYQVLLLDMAHFPRQKTCGDCMITDVEPNLRGLGLLDEVRQAGREVSGISIYSPSRYNFTVPADFVTLKRPVLDCMLARTAVDAGATFSIGQVTEIRVDGDGTVVAGLKKGKSVIRARLGIVATGAHIGLARKLGVVDSEKPSAIAMRCYIKSPFELNNLLLCYERNLLPGYGWIVPIGDGEFNVGCGYFLENNRQRTMRECFDDFIAGFPPVRELMNGSEVLAEPRSGAIRCGLTGAQPLYRNSIILAGETIGTTFPLTGEGIGQAMTTGVIAAAVLGEALAKNDRKQLEQYPAIIKAKLGPRHDGFRYAQKWLSRAWVNDFMARRVKKSKYLQNACADFISNSENPRRVYSLRAVLKSYWR